MTILVGDIGGTKAHLALARWEGTRIQLFQERRFSSRKFDSLEALLQAYLNEVPFSGKAAALALAGPVRADRCHLTNLGWEIQGAALAVQFKWDQVRLLNDLEAIAWGIPALEEGDLAVLHPGQLESRGNACVIAAGTGLGEAGLYWDGKTHWPCAGEGGHGDFAPQEEREIALLRWLQERYGHVSWERVVSGQGIATLYEFLCAQTGCAEAIPLAGDRAAAIARAAVAGTCPRCQEALHWFVRLYAREAGNAALRYLALGGVYLGGGIAPKQLHLLRSSVFLDAFFHKGRMADLLRQMPVRVILQPRTPLLGAARCFQYSAA